MTWTEPLMNGPSGADPSPSPPSPRRGIASITGASGDEAVSTEVVRPEPTEFAIDRYADDLLIERLAGSGKDKKAEETKATIRRELKRFAANLAGPSPNGLEKTLADVAATAWLALRTYEAHYAAASESGGSLTLHQSEHAQRRIDRAHRRLLATVRSLATVRRLGVPAIQVNVARQQVNVANST